MLACRGSIINLGGKYQARDTDVFHESIRANYDQKTSIPHKCHTESTMFPFRQAGIYVRGCDFSRNLGVKASVEPLAVSCRLSKVALRFPVVHADIGGRQ
jgi:hypothetical protein